MRPRANKYAGECTYCHETVPAMAGLLDRDRVTGAWQVRHRSAEWHGSPVSGRYIGGCPGEADRLNTRAS
jgi:hypothetical protein